VKRLVLLGLACYLLALLLTFPASLAIRLFAPETLGVQSPRGSVWSGSAAAASFGGYYFGKTDWSFRPFELLRGRIAYHIESQGPDGFVNGVFALTPGGDLRISGLSGTASIQALSPLLPPELPASLFKGRVQLELDDLHVADGWPQSAHGRVELMDLTFLAPPQPPELLGNYAMDLDTADGEPLRGSFKDVTAPLEIKGTLTLNADRTYDLQCTARAKPNASANLRQSIPLICPPS
jgi:hypothetical protein